jgi:hypothetical protein
MNFRTALGRDAAGTVRDDRVLPLTRWVAWFIIPFLAAAALVLYGVPDRTTEFFAWTIRPEMTPIVMGAGYAVGVYFFYRVSAAAEWHTVAPVFLGITAFTWTMAIATVLHWENFNHSHATFYLWVFLYAVTPFLVPAVWALNRRTDAREVSTGDRTLPRAVRVLGGGLGLVLVGSALAVFVAPDLILGRWPWTVSPLTARVLAGWIALFGVANGAAVVDPRWTGTRILVQCQIVGITLVLLGVLRVPDNFAPANALTWAGVGGVALYLGAIVALYLVMERR